MILWEALTGGPSGPAEIPGFGMLGPETARDLVGAACRDPRTRICVTILGPDGTARLHGCAPGRLDHTIPWDKGGLTCECGLAPPCRR